MKSHGHTQAYLVVLTHIFCLTRLLTVRMVFPHRMGFATFAVCFRCSAARQQCRHWRVSVDHSNRHLFLKNASCAAVPLQELQMREGTMNHEEDQPELNQAESQAVSVKASPIYKMQTAEESPVPPVSQIVPPVTAIHHHLAATAMQPADESVKGDSRLQLLCDEHSTGQPQLKADMPSLVQTDRRTDDASDEAEPAEQHQGTPEQPQGTPEQPQGIPGAHKRCACIPFFCCCSCCCRHCLLMLACGPSFYYIWFASLSMFSWGKRS